MAKDLPLLVHKEFSENVILVVPDLNQIPGLEGAGYIVAGTAELSRDQFQDRGSMHQYNLAGGFQIPVERAGYNGKRGRGDLYLITLSWKNRGKRIQEGHARAINPEAGPLVLERGKFRLVNANEEPTNINRILGYGPYGVRTNLKVRKIGELSETRNLDCNSKMFWLENFAFRAIVKQNKRISFIDFDPDEGACLG